MDLKGKDLSPSLLNIIIGQYIFLRLKLNLLEHRYWSPVGPEDIRRIHFGNKRL